MLRAALMLALCAVGLAACGPPDPVHEANRICAKHGGVRSFGGDSGWINPNSSGHAICRDGYVGEWP